jgi:hypothetical protein
MKKIIFSFIFLFVATMVFAQGLPRLAVVEFQTNDNSAQVKRDALTVRNTVRSQLARTGRFTVVSNTEIDAILTEQRIQIMDISSPENITRLQRTNVRYIVVGTVDLLRNDYQVSVSILDVTNAQYSHSEPRFVRAGDREMLEDINRLITTFMASLQIGERGNIVQVQPEWSPWQRTGIEVRERVRNTGGLNNPVSERQVMNILRPRIDAELVRLRNLGISTDNTEFRAVRVQNSTSHNPGGIGTARSWTRVIVYAIERRDR